MKHRSRWKTYGRWVGAGLLFNAAALSVFELVRSRELTYDGLYAARAALVGALLLFDNLCVLAWYAYLTRRSVDVAESVARQQAWLSLRQQYASAEMLHAVRTLWDFKRKSKNLVSDYRARLEADKRSLEALTPESRPDFVRGTLDFQRRLVSTFYQDLAMLAEFAFLRQLIYTQWIRDDLAIIPEVLMPIELDLGPDSPSLVRMRALYNDAPE